LRLRKKLLNECLKVECKKVATDTQI
jgi:hypothetical protein